MNVQVNNICKDMDICLNKYPHPEARYLLICGGMVASLETKRL